MKHTWLITMLFVLLFIVSQMFGLYAISTSTKEITQPDGSVSIQYTDTAIGARPEVNNGWETFAYIVVGVLLGTVILLLLAKFKKVRVWKTWFFLAAAIAMTAALGVFIKPEYHYIAFILALILAFFKVKYPNIVVHNFTEILMYAGIAVILVPILDITTTIIILVVFSIYDMYAVWKSKHMVKMAKFTAEANVFPGLNIAYNKNRGKTHIDMSPKKEFKIQGTKKTSRNKVGVLGGGDIVIPMLFIGSILTTLISQGIQRTQAYLFALIPVLTTAIALFLLFTYGKSDKFYPAMPYLTTGAIIGYLILIIL